MRDVGAGAKEMDMIFETKALRARLHWGTKRAIANEEEVNVGAAFCDFGGYVQQEGVIFGGYEIADVADYGSAGGNRHVVGMWRVFVTYCAEGLDIDSVVKDGDARVVLPICGEEVGSSLARCGQAVGGVLLNPVGHQAAVGFATEGARSAIVSAVTLGDAGGHSFESGPAQ